jgi:transposase
VARTCRHFGISRQAFYKWKRRFDAHGAAGLCDRPRRPQRSPRATDPAVVSKILYLRQTYHFGPGKIADYLKRFHQVSVARSSVHRILGRHGMNRLPANQKHQPHRKRWQRYETPLPGHRLAAGRQVPRAHPRHADPAVSTLERAKDASSLERVFRCQHRGRSETRRRVSEPAESGLSRPLAPVLRGPPSAARRPPNLRASG